MPNIADKKAICALIYPRSFIDPKPVLVLSN